VPEAAGASDGTATEFVVGADGAITGGVLATGVLGTAETGAAGSAAGTAARCASITGAASPGLGTAAGKENSGGGATGHSETGRGVAPGIHNTTLAAPTDIISNTIASIVNRVDRCVRFRCRDMAAGCCAERAITGSVVAPASIRDLGGASGGNSASQSRSPLHVIRRLGRRRTVEDPVISPPLFVMAATSRPTQCSSIRRIARTGRGISRSGRLCAG